MSRYNNSEDRGEDSAAASSRADVAPAWRRNNAAPSSGNEPADSEAEWRKFPQKPTERWNNNRNNDNNNNNSNSNSNSNSRFTDRFSDRTDRPPSDRPSSDRFSSGDRENRGDSYSSRFGSRDNNRDLPRDNRDNRSFNRDPSDRPQRSNAPGPARSEAAQPVSDRFRRPEGENNEEDGERSGSYDRYNNDSSDRRDNRGGGGGYNRDNRDNRPAHLRFGKSTGGASGGQDERFSRDDRGDRGSSGRYGDRGDRGNDRGDRYHANRPNPDDPLPSGPASKRREQQGTQLPRDSSSNVGNNNAAESKQQRAAVARNVAFDDSLKAVEVVQLAQKLTPLEKAVENRESIDEKQLIDSLKRIKLDESELLGEVSAVLARSLIENKINLKNLVAQTTKQQSQSAAELIIQTLSAYQDIKSDKQLQAFVKSSDVDILSVIAPNLSGQQLSDFLADNQLTILKPVADITGQVDNLIKSNASNDEFVKLINSSVDEKTSVNHLTSRLSSYIFARLFADKAAPNYEILSQYKPLLLRVLDDESSQVEFIFEAQSAWFKLSGAAKGVLKEIFSRILDQNIVDVEAFFGWRDDTAQKSAAKSKALLQVNAFITELEGRRKPKIPVEEYSGDEEEGEDEEEYDDDDDDY
jgi:hypothetical protein